MPFAFKLFNRLSRIWPGLIPIAASVACVANDDSINGPSRPHSRDLTALPSVVSVTVSPDSVRMPVGGTQQLTATITDALGDTLPDPVVTWSSSNPAAATVSESGLVTGIAPDTATIIATSAGVPGTSAVTVTTSDTSTGSDSTPAPAPSDSSPTPPPPPPPPAPAPPPASGAAFQSYWNTATGTSYTAVSDGNRWTNYWEFNNGTSVQLLSVVAGFGPGGMNALKVVQRGSNYAAALQQDNVLPASTDYYVRYYMRDDDTSPTGDHVVTPDIYSYGNLTYMRKFSGTSGWHFVISMYGCSYVYPIGHMGPAQTLARGVWYRFEYFVHFVDATHIQVHPRVYDASGTQILSDADFRQSDYGSATWNGRNDWTLASLYASGYSYCVDPTSLTHFAMGNNGQLDAVDTGLPWYYAGLEIRTDHWVGP